MLLFTMLDLDTLTLPQLFEALVAPADLDRLVRAARDEDLRDVGDVTSESIIEPDRRGEARIRARGPGRLAGLPVAAALVRAIDAAVDLAPAAADGDRVEAGSAIATLRGPLRGILAVERPVLNALGRLSGIATATAACVAAVAGTGARICDTRKTTPGMRGLEKYAVRCGGGTLHRAGLWDAALYKDNHLAHLSGDAWTDALARAAAAVRSAHDVRFVEVEVDTLEQLDRVLAIEAGLVDIVLLDNMAPAALREAVARRDARRSEMLLEASGGVTPSGVRAVAETGVDRIAVGAITHSSPALDVGLDIDA